MTNPENQVPNTEAKVVEKQETPEMKSEFLGRVSDIPAVKSATELGTAAYNQVKQMNRFTSAALSVAETTALYFAVTAKPFLEKVQPQAQYIDQVACRQLDRVEERAPFLMKPTEELVGDARKLCSSTLELGYQKVEGIKTMGTDTLSSVKNYGIEKANQALGGTEGFVDRYLPPAFGEGSQEAASESNSIPERASKLTSKIGLRLYGHGVKHLLPIHKLSQDSVSKLVYSVELLQQLKENYSKKSVQEYVDEAKVKATWIWEELNKEPAESAEAERSLEQRILSLARRTTSILVHVYNTTIPMSALPSTYQDGMTAARQYATELFAQFDQATNAGEIKTALLNGLREKLEKFSQTIDTLINHPQDQEEVEMQPLSPQQDQQ